MDLVIVLEASEIVLDSRRALPQPDHRIDEKAEPYTEPRTSCAFVMEDHQTIANHYGNKFETVCLNGLITHNSSTTTIL